MNHEVAAFRSDGGPARCVSFTARTPLIAVFLLLQESLS